MHPPNLVTFQDFFLERKKNRMHLWGQYCPQKIEIAELNPDPAQLAFVRDLWPVQLNQISDYLSFHFFFIEILVRWSKRVVGVFCLVLFVCLFPLQNVCISIRILHKGRIL